MWELFAGKRCTAAEVPLRQQVKQCFTKKKENMYTPGQKKWVKPKMAKYYTFNCLNNKSLVRK